MNDATALKTLFPQDELWPYVKSYIKSVHPCTDLIARFAQQNVLLFRTTDIRVGTEKKTPREQSRSGKKIGAYEALSELYAKAVVVQLGLSRCKDFRAAIIRMSEAVKDTKGTSYIRRWHSCA